VSQAEIQLRNLHPAEGDDAVRKTDRYEGVKALMENIRRFGLLVPLLVRPRQEDASQFDVIDGNRRLVALCEIHEDPSTVINCMVIGTEAGAGQALSANVMRQAMNPMDQYDVFAQLVAEGMKASKIGKLFDLPAKRVGQVLALAALASEIRDKVRRGDLSWEAAQALTLIRDQKVQLQMLEQHGDHAWGIHNAVHHEAPRFKTAIFDKNEYYLQGGQLLVDLFDEDPNGEELCADRELFWKLQMNAIDAELDKLRDQGWKAIIEDGTGPITYGRAGWPRRSEIRSKKARAKHSVIYQIEDDGRFTIWDNVMPEPEAMKEEKALQREEKREVVRAESEAAAADVKMTGNRPMSSTLVHDLKQARSRQVKIALTQNPRLAGRVLVMLFAMADHERGYTPRAADLQWARKCPEPETMQGFPLWDSFEREDDTTRDKPLGAMWKALAGATHDELVERLGHIAALAFDAQLPGAEALAKAILATEPVHCRSVWKPDAAFWQGCGRAFMLKALEECTNASVAARYKTEKVATLVIRMEKWFAFPDQLTWLNFGGRDEPLPDAVRDKLAQWTPAILESPRHGQSVDEIFLDQYESLDGDEFEAEEKAEQAVEAADQPAEAAE
jgi:ParB/RepB/Spo0J family partition protein